VEEPAASEGPVLPGGLTEDDHDIVRRQPGAGETLHELGEQLLPDLDAPFDRPEGLDQDGIVVAAGREVGIARVEAEVVRIELVDPPELVGDRNAGGYECGVNGIEDGVLEGVGVRFPNRQCDERRSFPPRRESWPA
jgi:hypothetical protein